MRIWRVISDDSETFFKSLTLARRHCIAIAGEFAPGVHFAGVDSPPEPWDWEFDGTSYSYAWLTIEPVKVQQR